MLRLVSHPGAGSFMRELLEALAAELPGVEVVDGFDGEGPWAFIPHEWRSALPGPEVLARTVAIHTEQPGTVWSARAISVAGSCGAVMDISPVGLVELRRNGLAAERLVLGASGRWVGSGGVSSERPVDVCWLASANRRRDVWLAAALPWLEPWSCALVSAPVDLASKPLRGAEKWDLLASSRVLLNVRSVIPPYFEWVRALEAIVNGCVYVTEHGAGFGPLVPGEHFLSAAPQNLGAVCDALLRDEPRREAMAAAARAAVPPMREGAEKLQALAETLTGAGCVTGVGLGAASMTHPEPSPAPDPLTPRLPDFTDPIAEPPPGAIADDATIRRELRERTLELRALQRRVRRAEVDDPDAIDVVVEHDPPPGARTTVCIPLFEYADHIAEAIASVHAQTLPVHLIVLDDASTDESVARAADALGERGTLLRRRVNAGLAPARNALLQHTSTPYALMLDADNALYPRAAQRLQDALDADPAAAFAFGPIRIERDGRPDGLLSHLGWHPDKLREANWIDALALLRKEAIGLDPYLDDPRLHGWEDYDLWCQVAGRGGHGAFVAQPIARYRRGSGTMLSLSDLDQDGMRRALEERHPSLFGDRGHRS